MASNTDNLNDKFSNPCHQCRSIRRFQTEGCTHDDPRSACYLCGSHNDPNYIVQILSPATLLYVCLACRKRPDVMTVCCIKLLGKKAGSDGR